MPLTAKSQSLDLSQQSIVLFTLEQTRADNRTIPWPRRLSVGSDGSKQVQSVAVDVTYMEYGDDDRHYNTLMRLALPPGKHRLVDLWCDVSAFPLRGTVTVPLSLDFEVPPQSVIYIGRINVHMRPRQDTEFRAGPLFPLIDQAALGISSSTLDITTGDQSAADLPRFLEAFPVLRKIEIKNNSLPSFDRAPLDASYR